MLCTKINGLGKWRGTMSNSEINSEEQLTFSWKMKIAQIAFVHTES